MNEPKSIYPLLCQAWGESDMPCAFIAYTEAEVRKFIVNEWWGDDTDERVDEVLASVRDHDWRDEPEWNAEFEIGGVSFKPVYESNSRAAVAAKPEAGEAVAWRELLTEIVESCEGYERRSGKKVNGDWVARARALLASAPTIQPTQPVQEREALASPAARLSDGKDGFDIGFEEGRLSGTMKNAVRLADLYKQIDDLTRERDEWKQQHENLLFVRQQDLSALTARISATPLAQAGDAGEPSDGERLTFEADPELTPAAFAERLARHMKVASLTAKEVSELTGVSETTLSRLKNHGRMPDAISYAALCNFMGWHPHIRHRLAIRATKGGGL